MVAFSVIILQLVAKDIVNILILAALNIKVSRRTHKYKT